MADVALVEVPTQLVLGLQRRGHYGDIAVVIGEVAQYGMAHGAQFIGPPVCVMHELSTEAAMKADQEGTAVIDIAFPVAAAVAGSDTVKCYKLAGGTMAKTVHKGPYEACGATYNALFEWLGKQGKHISGPTREVYLNDPREVKPEELLTEICAPVD